MPLAKESASKPVEVARGEATNWDWPIQHGDGVVKVINDNTHFEVGLEMQYFQPKEVDVKVVNRDLVVHCHHDERSDSYGSVSREFNRVYKLPADIDISTVTTKMQPNGVLHISASKARK